MLFRKKPQKFKIKIKPKKIRPVSRPKKPLLHIFRKKKPTITIKPSAPKPIAPVKPIITAKPQKLRKHLFQFLRKKKLEKPTAPIMPLKPAVDIKTRKEQSSFVSQKPMVSVKPEMLKVSERELVKGSYMKRNVNFSLFFLIIIILSSLVALTSYYQSSYNKQLSSLQQRTEEFSTALQELRVKKILLNQTSYQLELESKSKEQLGDLYTGVKQEKEALQSDLQKAKDQILAEQTKSAQLEVERANLRSELEDVKERLTIAEEEINELQDSITSLRAQKEDCETELSACCPNP